MSYLKNQQVSRIRSGMEISNMIFKFDEHKAFDYENGFSMTSEPYRIGNMIAHYELYKKIIQLPGDVIELGVFKGNSLIQFATFRELLENEKSRKIIGFDVFGNFPDNLSIESDLHFSNRWNESFKNDIPSREDILKSLDHKKISNVELIEGNILETVDQYLKKYPHTRIALLHIDTDVYEPAKYAFDKLFDIVVKNGVVILDDYGTVEGETIAVDEFLKNHDFNVNKFSFSHTKPSYIIKK